MIACGFGAAEGGKKTTDQACVLSTEACVPMSPSLAVFGYCSLTSEFPHPLRFPLKEGSVSVPVRLGLRGYSGCQGDRLFAVALGMVVGFCVAIPG